MSGLRPLFWSRTPWLSQGQPGQLHSVWLSHRQMSLPRVGIWQAFSRPSRMHPWQGQPSRAFSSSNTRKQPGNTGAQKRRRKRGKSVTGASAPKQQQKKKMGSSAAPGNPSADADPEVEQLLQRLKTPRTERPVPHAAGMDPEMMNRKSSMILPGLRAKALAKPRQNPRASRFREKPPVLPFEPEAMAPGARRTPQGKPVPKVPEGVQLTPEEIYMLEQGQPLDAVLKLHEATKKHHRWSIPLQRMLWVGATIVMVVVFYSMREKLFYDEHALEPITKAHIYFYFDSTVKTLPWDIQWRPLFGRTREEMEKESEGVLKRRRLFGYDHIRDIHLRLDERKRRAAFRREYLDARDRGVSPQMLELMQQMEKERCYMWIKVKELEKEFGDQREILFSGNSPEERYMRAFITEYNYPRTASRPGELFSMGLRRRRISEEEFRNPRHI